MSRFKRGGRADSLAGFQRADTAEPAVPNGLLNAARRSGQLNLSGRGLTEGTGGLRPRPGPVPGHGSVIGTGTWPRQGPVTDRDLAQDRDLV